MYNEPVTNLLLWVPAWGRCMTRPSIASVLLNAQQCVLLNTVLRVFVGEACRLTRTVGLMP